MHYMEYVFQYYLEFNYSFQIVIFQQLKFLHWLFGLILLYYLQIVFDDQNKDGQMVVNLFSSLNEFKCSGKFSNFCKDFKFLHSVLINHQFYWH